MKGIGALLTTFGVGELSAINGVAGSYAEKVPVVHIVGSPSTISQRDHLLLHHTFGDGDFQVFAKIYKNVTVAQANLHDLSTATKQIDSALRECLIKSQPVYIELPTDMVMKEVDGSRLDIPIDLSVPQNEHEVEVLVIKTILSKLYEAKRPLLLVDGGVSRHRLTAVVERLIRDSQLPTFVTPMGKGAVDESLTNFVGVYAGSGSFQSVRDFVEGSDLVLSFGTLKSDFNTTGFTYKLSELKSIDIHTEHTTIGPARYPVHWQSVIEGLASTIDPSKLAIAPFSQDDRREVPAEFQAAFPATVISHEYLWPAVSSWLQPNDILLTETGTSNLGVWDTKFPTGVTAISQTLWGSIGYTFPAAQGAALAARELDKSKPLDKKRRVILFEGDGSAQLTAQTIGTMLKHNLDIIIILINNDGYTIERWVHGMKAEYNDIPRWRYTDLPITMGGTEENCTSYRVTTRAELEALWASGEWQSGRLKGMHFVEMSMPKEDAPVTLKMVCMAAAKTNAT